MSTRTIQRKHTNAFTYTASEISEELIGLQRPTPVAHSNISISNLERSLQYEHTEGMQLDAFMQIRKRRKKKKTGV